MDTLKEIQGKMSHDSNYMFTHCKQQRSPIWVPGPIIVGAGPSGLAVAVCLKEQGIPSVVIEQSNCIASLWQLKTYDRLRLHLPKKFCELPLMPFPDNYPTYPNKQQFVEYLKAYAKRFGINPVLNSRVERAEYDESVGIWRVKSVGVKGEVVEYVCRWLVVATGENAEEVVPEIEGVVEFGGEVKHTSEYKNGSVYKGKKVLVVGCGNSGMEVCLDLCNHNAKPSLVVRDAVHVLPRDLLGKSTFELSMWLLKWLPMRIVDRFLLFVSWLILGNIARYGLVRPMVGPLELKEIYGKTPVLDVGALAKIKNGDIEIHPSIRRIGHHSVEFVNGETRNFDALIFATGYKSNVPSWLKEKDMFSEKDGYPRRPFPNGWKGAYGLYAVGFTKRGLLGASADAKRIAEDIGKCWKAKTNQIAMKKR